MAKKKRDIGNEILQGIREIKRGEHGRIISVPNAEKGESQYMPGYAEVFVQFLPTANGGRRLPVCLAGEALPFYRPHFRVRGGDGEMLGVEFVDGPDEALHPGQSAYATVRFLFEPEVCYDALSLGAEFDVLEGGRIVATGRVTRR